MINMRISEAAALLEARWQGTDEHFAGMGIDTRDLCRGALFVALKGEKVHGHEFVEHARRRGAAAALVERADLNVKLPLITVTDTRRAMGTLSRAWREGLDLNLVAVTGSNGKTTVKEMLIGVLRQGGRVMATTGNLNNDLGVPLTLARLGPEHRYAVVEMGANHAGEIAYLVNLARPNVGVITQCAPAHLEGFGSVQGVARAKGELLEGLPAGGIAVINGDDPFADLWRKQAGSRTCLRFGLGPEVDVSATWQILEQGSELQIRTPRGAFGVHLALPGRHNVMNALAAAAAAVALEVPLEDIATGLGAMGPVRGRLQLRTGRNRARVLDDTYNANPASLEAGLAVLEAAPGRHWLVLGDMAELGAEAAEYHVKAGRAARQAGVERLFAVGPLAREAARSFGRGARHFESRDALVEALEPVLEADVTLLVKGSRSMGMESVVQAVTGED